MTYVDAGMVGMLIGSGSGTFPTSSTYSIGSLPGDVGVADFNRDGKPDVAVNCEGSNAVLLRIGFGNGTFFPAQRSPGRTASGVMSVADLDGDSRPDLLLANEAAGTLTLQMNAVP